MQSFQTFLLESFDKPARWKWKEKPQALADGIDITEDDYFYSATFKAGVKYTVRLNSFQGDDYWSVEFVPSSEISKDRLNQDFGKDPSLITRKNPKNANSQEVLATVIDIVREFVDIVDPNQIIIQAVKEGQIDDLNRPRIYKKLIDRFMPNNYTSNIEKTKYGTVFKIYKTG